MDNCDIFAPYQLGNKITVKNRIVLAPMDMATSLFDGTVSERDINFHRSRSRDVGIDIVGSAYVSLSGNTMLRSISACKNSDINGLGRLADSIHQNQTAAILQLVHAGRKTTTKDTYGDEIVGPSPVKAPHGNFPTPKELSVAEIMQIADEFVAAAKRACQAGFDGIELHGANTFLLQQFLSPLGNVREDEFGGNLYRRLKLSTIIVSRIKTEICNDHPNFVIGYRISPEEYEPGGLTVKDTIAQALLLERLGIDYLSLSLHSYNQVSNMVQQGVRLAPLFKKTINLPLMVSGSIANRNSIEEASKAADLIGVATALLKDGNWLKKQV